MYAIRSYYDFALASELKADEHGPALCDGKIDGFVYLVGHPSATTVMTKTVTPRRGVSAVEALTKRNNFV